MKKRVQKTKENRIVNFVKKNKLFFVSIIITIIFIIAPLWLRIPCLRQLISFFLIPLKEQGFKSSYIETLGAFLGTFLAVTGALWTQKQAEEKADKENREKLERENRFRIVTIYYDLKLAFKDLEEVYKMWLCVKLTPQEVPQEKFSDYCKTVNIYIDSNWIRNVSALGDVFEEEFIEEIFVTYGKIDTLSKYLNDYDNEFVQIKLTSLLSHFFTWDSESRKCLNEKYIKMLERLKVEGNIQDEE